MAYMSQERKKELAAKAKVVLKKYGVKATFAVDNHSTLVCNIKSGPIDFIENFNDTQLDRPGRRDYVAANYLSVNPYYYKEHFSGKAKEFLCELLPIMNEGNHDRSDIMTDYFDVGWYVDVNIGKWDKPYELVK